MLQCVCVCYVTVCVCVLCYRVCVLCTVYVCCVTALDHSSEEVSQQVEKLKECISVLFGFHRRPTKDAEFVENTRKWTERLVSAPAVCVLEITLHSECVCVFVGVCECVCLCMYVCVCVCRCVCQCACISASESLWSKYYTDVMHKRSCKHLDSC